MARRRYTKREKLAAVMAAEMSGLTMASEKTGVPKSTLKYWCDAPAFAQFRTKTREEMATEVKVVAHLAWKRIAETLASGEMEPRDAIFAAEKATTLMQLLSGEATSRTESREWTDELSDHEQGALRDAIDRELARREAEGDTSEVAVDSATTPETST